MPQELFVTELPALEYKGTSYRRRFIDTGAGNDLGHNLTELRAATDTAGNNPDEDDNTIGFSRHPDWCAHVHRYAFAGRMIDKLAPRTLLDAGCGLPPQLPFYLNKNRFRPPADCAYWGIELRATIKSMTAETPWGGPWNRYKAHMHVVRGDLVRDDFSLIPEWPGQFEMVISFECFEHVPVASQPEFMARLFAWTRPGGICLFSTPNAGISRSTAENHTEPTTGETRERTYQDKLAMAQASGFVLEAAFGTFSAMSYLPDSVRDHYQLDPYWVRLKAWYDISLFNCLIAVANPEHANNALMVFRRPDVPSA